jgi:hypothetical protein
MKLSAPISLLLAAAACNATPGPDLPHFIAQGTANIGDGGDRCIIIASGGAVDTERLNAWEGTVRLAFSRMLMRNGEEVKRDTLFPQHQASLSKREPDTTALSLSGPITATLLVTRSGTGPYFGDWVCDARFPLGDDSSTPRQGRWGLYYY